MVQEVLVQFTRCGFDLDLLPMCSSNVFGALCGFPGFQAVDRTSNSRVALKIIKNRSRVMEQAREEHHILKYLNARDPQQLTGVGR